MTVSAIYRKFEFKNPSGTSRGILTEKHAWFLTISKENMQGVGECSVIPGLSPDFESLEQYQALIDQFCLDLNQIELERIQSLSDLKKSEVYANYTDQPSLIFGLETALLDYWNGGKEIYFNNDFSAGKQAIPINGLIWMGEPDYMLEQLEKLKSSNFDCIKLKIGAISFRRELDVLNAIREAYSNQNLTLRVDANGAFEPNEAEEKLEQLSVFNLHSIEQPIRQGQFKEMSRLCSKNTVPIALDEELIGVSDRQKKIELLDTIEPQYIILKPSLHGGILGTQEWIELAQERSIDFWLTSALESNIGLNCICQLTAEYPITTHHGLGTGSLYINNIPSKLAVSDGHIQLKLTDE